ncbi:PucR family transcriptional regulator [Trebonia kvetii]|uniref:PucR family transcriptional regulator n=1 Tax=Trebonia kvetii TaxID=2480626 RepID=A0A6P2C6Y3_9ACTN|nr:PucR family transcriptional regulator [Trebonia kvetii]TVZ05283.1 PucR family transcriptional regulator [Trebonia kvetii]
MAITVRDLIRLPHLRFTVVAGEAGLDNEVSWVHTSDLPEPWKWHGAGELLLTNTVGLPAEEAEQVQFVERLSECDASGLGIGLGLSGPSLLAGARRRADELALPLLTVPLSTPFTAIVRAVADANSREESRQLWRVSRLYELLRTSAAAGSSGQELFRKLGEELGVRLSVVDPATGHSLFGEGECRYAAELAAGYGTHGNTLPAMLTLRPPHAEPGAVAAVAVAMPGEHPTALVVEFTDGQLPSMVLLHHVAVGGALELARLMESQERMRRLGSNTLTRLLDRRIDSHAAQLQLAELGLDLAKCVLIAASAAGDGTAAHRRLAAARVPHALLHRDHTVYFLLPATALDTAVAAEIWPSPGGGTARLGVSDRITSPSRVADAAQEARWALAVASASGQRAANYGDESMTLPPRTPAEARVLVSRILAPLIRHDAGHSTDYVATLQTFLRTDRSWRDAAAELHIHRQTLGYRLRKIEQLTGRGVTRTDHIAQWWLALRARDLLAGQPGDR